MMNDDEKWMEIAILEAEKAENENEVPVGAIITKNNKIIAKGHNQPISKNDPTAHAEIQAIRLASNKQENYRLTGATLFVTLEPCAMCLGAMMHARINRIVFGAYDLKSGVCGSSINLQNKKKFNHEIITVGGVLEKKCKDQLQ